LFAHSFDAAEERLVQINPVPVRGEARGRVALDLKQRVVGVSTRKNVKKRCHAGEQVAAALERHDRVLECRGGGLGSNRLDFAGMLCERPCEG
jgi:hypothetical protein